MSMQMAGGGFGGGAGDVPPGAPPGGYGAPPGGYGAPPGGPTPPKKGPSALAIGLVVAGLVVVLGAAAIIVVYFVRGPGGAAEISDGKGGTISLPAKISSKAHPHLPATCDVVARADAGALLDHEAVKKHVIPALDELQASAGKDPSAKDAKDTKEVEELLRLAGIDPKSDVKEVLLCMSELDGDQRNAKMTLVLGGEFRPDAVATAVERSAAKDDKIELITVDGRKAAKKTTGDLLIIGQAADGAIVVANDQAMFEAAVKESTAYQATYALPMSTEVAFVVSERFLQRARTNRNLQGNPFAKDITATTRVSGFVALKGDPRGEVRATMAGEKEAAELAKGLEQLILPALKKQGARQKSQAGELEVLSAAKVRVEGKDVVVEAPWSAAGVDQAAQKLAGLIRDTMKKKR